MILIALLFFKMVFPEEALSLQEKLFIANYYYNTEWKYTIYDNGIGLGERWFMVNDSMGVRERSGEMIVICNYNKAIKYLSDYQNINHWMKNVKTLNIQSDTAKILQLIFAMPWPVTNRDVVVNFTVFQVDNNSSIIRLSSLPDAPIHQGTVRIKHYQTTIQVERLDYERTKITVSTFTDETPMLPVKIQDPLIRKSLYKNLLQLKLNLAQL